MIRKIRRAFWEEFSVDKKRISHLQKRKQRSYMSLTT
jgi:hypothetical protein